MISLIIPTYRNPKCFDICPKSASEGKVVDSTEIIVVVDGYVSESEEVLSNYNDSIKVLRLENNQGMQTALNLGVMNASNENIMIINDDNAESLQKLMIGIEKILKTRQTLLDVIERRGERQKIVGDKQLSFLESKLDRDNDK